MKPATWSDDFEQRLPDLKTYLEGLIAAGEDDEGRLTVADLTSIENPAGAGVWYAAWA